MGVFDDKKFDELDWLSKAIEPYHSELNTTLAALPDSIELDFQVFTSAVSSYNLTFNVQNYLARLAIVKDNPLSWAEQSALSHCFAIESSNPDQEIIINFVDKIITPKLFLVKIKSTLDEKVIADMLGHKGLDKLLYITANNESNVKLRMKEVLDILGSLSGTYTTTKKGMASILTRLREIFRTNEWKIRDAELADKVGYWIRDYIINGNLAAFSNLCRLKVMTHKGEVIYSIEEVK